MAADETTVNITNGTYSFDIMSDRIERDFNKKIFPLNVPKNESPGGSLQNKTPISNVPNPLTRLQDIKILNQLITVFGWLEEEEGNTASPDNTKSALYKLDQLEAIMSTVANVTITWKINTQVKQFIIKKFGVILKAKTSERPGRIGELHPDEQDSNSDFTQGKMFPIILSFQVGSFRG